ncbi:DUF6503 family protein [Aquimarina agarivorans]|uniref:DUF6503 family protein n=1 Tax=Aquimarina agarivorans TaxID=980584 RepID=UPI000248FCC9|nr:DUF6503 family protein [Aquimarina agarivorans]
MKSILITYIFATLLTTSCKNTNEATASSIALTQNQEDITKADQIIEKTIQAHGGNLYHTADYSFTFRKKLYRFTNNGSDYTYTVTYQKNNTTILDVITNGSFKRFVNEQEIELNQKQTDAGFGALNSVIYFATLPYKLNDPSVNKKLIEKTVIKNENYDVIEVTFNKEGGGKDHDDEFYYWINKKTHKIDYLAYNYQVNKGGVRFRSFYNRSVVDGITFQDYINWKAPVGTPLQKLPTLFEQNKLKELSRIETENITHLKN